MLLAQLLLVVVHSSDSCLPESLAQNPSHPALHTEHHIGYSFHDHSSQNRGVGVWEPLLWLGAVREHKIPPPPSRYQQSNQPALLPTEMPLGAWGGNGKTLLHLHAVHTMPGLSLVLEDSQFSSCWAAAGHSLNYISACRSLRAEPASCVGVLPFPNPLP